MIKEHKLYTKSDSHLRVTRWEAQPVPAVPAHRRLLAAASVAPDRARAARRGAPRRSRRYDGHSVKIAVRIEELNTRIKIALPSAYPYRNALIAMAASIAAQGP